MTENPVGTESAIATATIAWFKREARELPWRATSERPVSAWAVLVSEFMLQQTQASRVIPYFEEWMERWPAPSALAAESPGEAVRAWGRLGYPRRALWLHRAATEIAEAHGDEVPRDVESLLALTGIGPYTARAVASFAYSERHPVVDTNTRRVLARVLHGRAAAGAPKPSDLDDMNSILPPDPLRAQQFNAAAMELGATVCTARTPRCADCPIASWCEWRGAGYPDNTPAVRRQAKFEGSDRQVRGRIMALLRQVAGEDPRLSISRDAALEAAEQGGTRDAGQAHRALDSLVADGLVVEFDGAFRLP